MCFSFKTDILKSPISHFYVLSSLTKKAIYLNKNKGKKERVRSEQRTEKEKNK